MVALLCFGSSLAFVGFLIPAAALLLFVGGLAGTDLLDPLPILIAASLGATLGSLLSYWLGRRLGLGFARRPFLRPHRRHVARARLLLRRHTFKAVFLSRFLAVLRNTVPLVAGMVAMRPLGFQIANVPSALLWPLLLLEPGYLGMQGLETGLYPRGAARGVPRTAAVSVVMLLLVLLVRLLRRRWAIRRAERCLHAGLHESGDAGGG